LYARKIRSRNSRFFLCQGCHPLLRRKSTADVEISLTLVSAEVQDFEGSEVLLRGFQLTLYADQSLAGGVDAELTQVSCNPLPRELFSYGCSRTRAHEKVSDQVALVGARLDDALQQCLGLLCRVP
jgi:hypothetical protein